MRSTLTQDQQQQQRRSYLQQQLLYNGANIDDLHQLQQQVQGQQNPANSDNINLNDVSKWKIQLLSIKKLFIDHLKMHTNFCAPALIAAKGCHMMTSIKQRVFFDLAYLNTENDFLQPQVKCNISQTKRKIDFCEKY